MARRIRQRELASSAGKEKKETGDGLEDDEDDDIVPKAPETGPDAPQFGTRKVYEQLHRIITALAGVDEYQSIALSMFLEACRSASETGFKDPAYEFVTRAFTLYEDTADSKAQVTGKLFTTVAIPLAGPLTQDFLMFFNSIDANNWYTSNGNRFH